jgi:hypothetical protein
MDCCWTRRRQIRIDREEIYDVLDRMRATIAEEG